MGAGGITRGGWRVAGGGAGGLGVAVLALADREMESVMSDLIAIGHPDEST